ncbi:speckle-type POZ protein B-like [Cotesia glomerata]|uniref:speckle-type POZ protein B-like n=1 Tax=Cotesia glomerata TaxID=32391 RepID=UPI001D01DA8F|nr:speckle-type POZ protein B-like [Cotesia glomerata]XP_044591072.1 speckle-type POZ protein B-like [Cotesia glomerata]XP_044591073.1 speckle-type POZ protein B-like [Cotesia glomerata]
MDKYRTRTVSRKLSYEWEIADFTALADTPNFGVRGSEIRSPKFSVNTSFENEWHLELTMTEKRFIVFVVSDVEDKEMIIRTQFSVSILNEKKEKKFNKVYNQLFTGRVTRSPEISLIQTLEIMNSRSEFLPNNVLTVCLDLAVYDECTEIIKFPSKSPKYMISEDFKKLLDDNIARDITLVVNEKEYQAHKVILMARSPFFYAMLTHDMKEKQENKITVPSIDPKIFEKMIEYIYSDRVTNNLDSCAEQMLEVADQYQLLGLVEMCEESLSKSITVENAMRVLVLADKFNAQQLLEFSLNFVVSNISRIKNTKEYQQTINDKSNPFLTMKIVEKFVAA